MGRGALRAYERGIGVLFGERADAEGRLVGLLATPGGWEARAAFVDGVFDRFRDQLHPARYAAARGALRSPVWLNAPEVTGLCRDKLGSQRALEAAGILMPEVVDADFRTHLEEWGSGFLKPRYGSFGRGVRRVVPGDPLPLVDDGMRPGDRQPMLLQRAVPPPSTYAGVCVRALVQAIEDHWVCRTPVARTDRDSAVVNVARGAQVAPAAEVFGETVDRALREAAVAAGEVVGRWGDAVEVGVDLVVGPSGEVRVIEVNGRPRGRLAAIADRGACFREEHEAACTAPLLELARRAAVSRGEEG